MNNSTPVIKIQAKKVLIVLLSIAAVIVALSIYGQRIKYFGVSDIRGPWHEALLDLLKDEFYMDAEGNMATFYNAILLFIPALLLSGIGVWKNSIKDKFRFHWIGLALIFLYLATDEAAVLHERLIKPMRAIFGSGGVFYFAWVVPGAAAVVLFGLAYLMFFLHLDRKFKILFFISLAVYIGGVLGGEVVSGYYAASIGQKKFEYAVVASLEESIELIGCSLLIYSLLKYIEQYLPEGLTLKAE